MTDNTPWQLNVDFDKLDWQKVDGLMPVIVQNYQTGVVLMQGFMNQEALQTTIKLGKVTFYSRTKQRLWTKGEESHHYLLLKAISDDCDHDCLLIAADPIGPTCHRGTESCFDGHLPLASSHIAAFKANTTDYNSATVQQLCSIFCVTPNAKNATDLLKAILSVAQKNNITITDIDQQFN